jgi:hypothetical protein
LKSAVEFFNVLKTLRKAILLEVEIILSLKYL